MLPPPTQPITLEHGQTLLLTDGADNTSDASSCIFHHHDDITNIVQTLLQLGLGLGQWQGLGQR